MGDGLPLATLLSPALVAFTIEFDNEAEPQMAHRTTTHGSTHGSTAGSHQGPWLVSLAMWENCMRGRMWKARGSLRNHSRFGGNPFEQNARRKEDVHAGNGQ